MLLTARSSFICLLQLFPGMSPNDTKILNLLVFTYRRKVILQFCPMHIFASILSQIIISYIDFGANEASCIYFLQYKLYSNLDANRKQSGRLVI